MNNRNNILENLFAELETDQERQQFLDALSELETTECINRLRIQFQINPESRFAMRNCLREAFSRSDTNKCFSLLDSFEQAAHQSISSSSTVLHPREEKEHKIDDDEDKMEELSSDPITYEAIKVPYITPQGTTYDQDIIKKIIKEQGRDPQTRAPLSPDDLRPNKLFTLTKDCYENNNLSREQLKRLLTCPLSGKLFTDPVVAVNGVTYERQPLEDWLKLSKGTLPDDDGTMQKEAALYPNRFINNFRKLPTVLPIYNQKTSAEEETEQARALTQPLEHYITMRKKEKCYNSRFGLFSYSRKQKIDAAKHAIKVLEGKESPHSFFTQHECHIKVLQQGRLKEIAAPALRQIKCMNS